MGTIKDRNDTDLTEAEDIKKRWQEYTEELYQKDLHDPDNHEGVITPTHSFFLVISIFCAHIILKDDAVKVLHSICQQTWKTQQWPQDWEMSVFILIPKKGNAKECSSYQTIVLIC